MRVALAQVNVTVGDFNGNIDKIREKIKEAKKEGANLIVFPELALTGYPPKDLLEQSDFISQNKKTLKSLCSESKEIGIIVGCLAENDHQGEKPLFNAAAMLHKGKIQQIYAKRLLPNYDVFDETRHFSPGSKPGIFEFEGRRIGITICEDIWNDKIFWEHLRYPYDPVEDIVAQRVDCLINISASPYGWDKEKVRDQIICGAASRHKIPFLFCNLVGGNDELVFDGRSMAVDETGQIVAQAKAFEEDLLIVDLNNDSKSGRVLSSRSPFVRGRPKGSVRQRDSLRHPPSDLSLQTLFDALALGVHDYVKKCGFEKVTLGLSGGIDSALTAVIATKALGADSVLGLLMPSQYTSNESIEDALELAKNLNINTETISIDSIVKTYEQSLAKTFKGYPPNETEENIQARARGNLLMAISNKLGHLVLSTGNKSELSIGYCTLYGDMSGGLAVLSDLPKTLVYDLVHWINRDKKIIPQRILEKPPSAELKPNQKDQDTLPPYETLDAILNSYIEEHQGRDAIIEQGFDPKVVDWVIGRVMANEYKRRQMPVGIKVSKKAFGSGRRFPIARK